MQACHSLALSLTSSDIFDEIVYFHFNIGGGKQGQWNENVALGALAHCL